MAFLKNLFGKGDPLATMEKALRENRWADALAAGEKLQGQELAPETSARVHDLLAAAGDGLAMLNLTEGEGCLRAGEIGRAIEHFSLASEQARGEELKERIAQAMTDCSSTAPSAAPVEPVSDHSCASGCCSSSGDSPAESEPVFPVEGEPDSQDLFELILGGLPTDLASRYRGRGVAFRNALLAAHREEEGALHLLDLLPEEGKDDLFFFERGSLLGRLGQTEAACRDLERAVDLNPQHLLALDALVGLELSEGQTEKAARRLCDLLDQGVATGFCHAGLAAILAGEGDPEQALIHGEKALAQGHVSPDTIFLVASLLEKDGRVEEAEHLLMRIPGGGCSGGANVYLAEFWLRQGKNLQQALEGFKGALRQDNGNPRWALRIAQTYLALGWTRDGRSLLEKTLSDPNFDPALRREAEASMASIGKERS